MFTQFGNGLPGTGREIASPIPVTLDGNKALELAGIDWKVEAKPLSDIYAASSLIAPSNSNETLISTRSDTGDIVGINGHKYHVIQNTVLAEFGEAIQRIRPDARYIGGGSLRNGKKTFLMMELDNRIDLGNNDIIERHILLSKGHNGDSIVGMGVSHRLSCTNQWTSLTKNKPRLISIRHTSTARQRIEEAVRFLELTFDDFSNWDKALRDLVTLPVTFNESTRYSDTAAWAIAGPRPKEEGRALTEWTKRLDNLWSEYQQDFNAELVGTGAGLLMAAQGADEHLSRVNKNMSKDEQRVTRMLNQNYPMAARAMAYLS